MGTSYCVFIQAISFSLNALFWLNCKYLDSTVNSWSEWEQAYISFKLYNFSLNALFWLNFKCLESTANSWSEWEQASSPTFKLSHWVTKIRQVFFFYILTVWIKICIIEVYILKYYFESHFIYKWRYYGKTIFNQ